MYERTLPRIILRTVPQAGGDFSYCAEGTLVVLLHERIRHVREMAKLTQSEFAERLGVSRGHISRIETGTAEPSEQLMISIAEIFMVRWPWLTHGQGPTRPDFDKLEMALQNVHFNHMTAQTTTFLRTFDMISTNFLEVLNSHEDLKAELCPNELIEKLQAILELPNHELFNKVRQKLSEWSTINDKG